MTNTKKKAPVRDRSGVYTLPDGTRCMSVTTIIGKGVPKPALPHWAAREVAQCAIDNIPKLVRARGRLARQETYEWLRRAAETKKEAAADLGTAIHNVVEAQVLGTPMPEPTDEQRPFVDAFNRFFEVEKPEYEATELVVANPTDGWAGTLDAALRLPVLAAQHPDIEWLAGLLAADYKTGNGVWGEAGMQMSAYRRATLGWLKDGTEVQPPETVGAVVVHLRPQKYPDTGYRVFPMDTSDEVYRAFLAARDTALHWASGLDKRVVGEPFAPEETS